MSSLFATTGPVSTCSTPTNYSGFFSASTCQTNSTAPALGWPTCTASFPATAGVLGPKASWTPGPPFTSLCPNIVETSRNSPHCVRVITSCPTPQPAPLEPGRSGFQPNPTRPLNCDSTQTHSPRRGQPQRGRTDPGDAQ